MTRATSPRGLWWLMVIGSVCYYTVFVFYPGLYLAVGTNHYGVWFLDSFAIMASNDALSRGLDPYLPNALDYFNRPHVYSHWWLHLRDLGLGRVDNGRVGFGLVAGFFVAAVVRLRPREPREVLWYLAVLCCSPILLAVNRANNDLVVFLLLAPVVPCLASSSRAVRLIPVALIAMAAGLKFYPAIAALVLCVGGDARESRLRVIFVALALTVVGLNVFPDLARIGPLLPKAEGLMTFGAANLFEGAGLAARAARLAAFTLGAVAVVCFFWRNPFRDWEIPRDDWKPWWSFILGAVLLSGCFFAGTNYAYRWVFALWLAPLLWLLPRDARAPLVVRRFARLTGMLLIVALWADPLASVILTALVHRISGEVIGRAADIYFAIEQPVVWALFICLLGFIVHFVRSRGRELIARS